MESADFINGTGRLNVFLYGDPESGLREFTAQFGLTDLLEGSRIQVWID
jgi:hypothetical protein